MHEHVITIKHKTYSKIFCKKTKAQNFPTTRKPRSKCMKCMKKVKKRGLTTLTKKLKLGYGEILKGREILVKECLGPKMIKSEQNRVKPQLYIAKCNLIDQGGIEN